MVWLIEGNFNAVKVGITIYPDCAPMPPRARGITIMLPS